MTETEIRAAIGDYIERWGMLQVPAFSMTGKHRAKVAASCAAALKAGKAITAKQWAELQPDAGDGVQI